jgi:hypothetical protein
MLESFMITNCYIVFYTYQGDKSDRKEEYLLLFVSHEDLFEEPFSNPSPYNDI